MNSLVVGFLTASSIFLILAFLFFTSAVAGRRYGQTRLAHTGSKLEVVAVAEGAVFALLGLLIAFTFSGAYDRFELRKTHILEEANAFETAYQRIDLLDKHNQGVFRQDLRQYLTLHLAAYADIPNFKKINEDQKQFKELEEKIWRTAAIVGRTDKNQGMAQLFVLSINNMFELANSGMNMIWVHPPLVIFLLLIVLAMLGAFLSGYNTAENSVSQSLHILCYVILTALTIYLVIDLEFPRAGLIRVDAFDAFLEQVRDRMQG